MNSSACSPLLRPLFTVTYTARTLARTVRARLISFSHLTCPSIALERARLRQRLRFPQHACMSRVFPSELTDSLAKIATSQTELAHRVLSSRIMDPCATFFYVRPNTFGSSLPPRQQRCEAVRTAVEIRYDDVVTCSGDKVSPVFVITSMSTMAQV